MNTPVKIIFNLDVEENFEFDNLGLQCVKSFLTDTVILKNYEMQKCDRRFMEHCLVEGALRYVDKNRTESSYYNNVGFALSIRADMFVAIDIPSNVVYAENALFWYYSISLSSSSSFSLLNQATFFAI